MESHGVFANLLMTFKNIKRSGQSIAEYIILTAVVCTAVLLFTNTTYFKSIQKSCEDAFDRSVGEILQ